MFLCTVRAFCVEFSHSQILCALHVSYLIRKVDARTQNYPPANWRQLEKYSCSSTNKRLTFRFDRCCGSYCRKLECNATALTFRQSLVFHFMSAKTTRIDGSQNFCNNINEIERRRLRNTDKNAHTTNTAN